MVRFLFRCTLATIAIAAIVFGVWYYVANNQTDSTVHGTLVWDSCVEKV